MAESVLKLILLEDNPGDAYLIKDLLSGGGLSIEVFETLARGLERIGKGGVEVIALDLALSDSSGFETFEKIRRAAPDIPVVILTGTDDEELAVRAVRSGAQDYLVKGRITSDLLRRSIMYALERNRAEQVNRRIMLELSKRVREQKTLYRAAALMQDCNADPDVVIGELVKALPEAWQFKDIAEARIIFDEKEFKTSNFMETPWMQKAQFTSANGVRWSVEIAYLRERPRAYEGPFLKEERDLLDSIADMLKACCERRHALQSLEWESGVNVKMAELSKALISSMSVEEISYMVLNAAKQFTGSEFGYVGYVDRDGNLASRTLTEDVWEKCRVKDKELTFGKTRGLFGWVLKNKTPVISNDLSSDERSYGTPPGHLPIRRFLSVPALIGDELIGQISVANSDHDYTEKDLMLAERLAVVYAQTVRREQEIEALRQADIAIGNSPTLIFRCRAEEGLPIEYISNNVIKYGYPASELYGAGALSFVHPDDLPRVKAEIKERILSGLDDFKQEYRMLDRNRSVLWADVRLNLLRDKAGKVTHLQGVVNDITERKTAELRLKEEMELTSGLLSISRAAASMTDVSRLLEQVAISLRTVLKADAVLSYVWDRQNRFLKPEQASGLAHTVHLFKTMRLRMESGRLKDCFEKNVPFLSIAEEAGWIGPLSWTRAHSAIFIPLSGNEGPLGLLVSLYTDKSAPALDDNMRKLLEGVSFQVSTALMEAQLYKTAFDKTIELSRRVETIQTMHEIGRSILSTLDRKEILDTAAMLLSKIIPCDKTLITLVDSEAGGLRYQTGFGLSIIRKGEVIKSEDTTASEVVRTCRPQYTPNLKELTALPDFERRLMDCGFSSLIRVPIIIKGEVTGVLSCGSKRPSGFSYDDLSTLEKLSSQFAIALENSRLLTDLEELFLGTLKALTEAIDAKSPWTRGHSERVTRISLLIGTELGLSEQDLKSLKLAALLHDIGKLGTYEAILDKQEKLTPEEERMIRLHPEKGAEILFSIKQLRDVIPAIRHHHEAFDGSGYPAGLKNGEIPVNARVIAVADTVDAMCADRPYRKGKDIASVIMEVQRCACAKYDPGVVEAFLKVHERGEILPLIRSDNMLPV